MAIRRVHGKGSFSSRFNHRWPSGEGIRDSPKMIIRAWLSAGATHEKRVRSRRVLSPEFCRGDGDYVAEVRFWRRKWSPDDQISSGCDGRSFRRDDFVARVMSPSAFLATKPLFSDLRCALRLDRVGLLELTFTQRCVTFCREVLSSVIAR
jgi:hypothetical protein